MKILTCFLAGLFFIMSYAQAQQNVEVVSQGRKKKGLQNLDTEQWIIAPQKHLQIVEIEDNIFLTYNRKQDSIGICIVGINFHFYKKGKDFIQYELVPYLEDHKYSRAIQMSDILVELYGNGYVEHEPIQKWKSGIVRIGDEVLVPTLKGEYRISRYQLSNLEWISSMDNCNTIEVADDLIYFSNKMFPCSLRPENFADTVTLSFLNDTDCWSYTKKVDSIAKPEELKIVPHEFYNSTELLIFQDDIVKYTFRDGAVIHTPAEGPIDTLNKFPYHLDFPEYGFIDMQRMGEFIAIYSVVYEQMMPKLDANGNALYDDNGIELFEKIDNSKFNKSILYNWKEHKLVANSQGILRYDLLYDKIVSYSFDEEEYAILEGENVKTFNKNEVKTFLSEIYGVSTEKVTALSAGSAFQIETDFNALVLLHSLDNNHNITEAAGRLDNYILGSYSPEFGIYLSAMDKGVKLIKIKGAEEYARTALHIPRGKKLSIKNPVLEYEQSLNPTVRYSLEPFGDNFFVLTNSRKDFIENYEEWSEWDFEPLTTDIKVPGYAFSGIYDYSGNKISKNAAHQVIPRKNNYSLLTSRTELTEDGYYLTVDSIEVVDYEGNVILNKTSMGDVIKSHPEYFIAADKNLEIIKPAFKGDIEDHMILKIGNGYIPANINYSDLRGLNTQVTHSWVCQDPNLFIDNDTLYIYDLTYGVNEVQKLYFNSGVFQLELKNGEILKKEVNGDAEKIEKVDTYFQNTITFYNNGDILTNYNKLFTEYYDLDEDGFDLFVNLVTNLPQDVYWTKSDEGYSIKKVSGTITDTEFGYIIEEPEVLYSNGYDDPQPSSHLKSIKGKKYGVDEDFRSIANMNNLFSANVIIHDFGYLIYQEIDGSSTPILLSKDFKELCRGYDHFTQKGKKIECRKYDDWGEFEINSDGEEILKIIDL